MRGAGWKRDTGKIMESKWMKSTRDKRRKGGKQMRETDCFVSVATVLAQRGRTGGKGFCQPPVQCRPLCGLYLLFGKGAVNQQLV